MAGCYIPVNMHEAVGVVRRVVILSIKEEEEEEEDHE